MSPLIIVISFDMFIGKFEGAQMAGIRGSMVAGDDDWLCATDDEVVMGLLVVALGDVDRMENMGVRVVRGGIGLGQKGEAAKEEKQPAHGYLDRILLQLRARSL